MITQFHKDTPKQVRDVLQSYCHNGEQIRLWLGNVKTGEVWQEENDVIGTIGNSRSTDGKHNVPLLIANRRSMGGGAILDHCIVRLMDCKTRRVLYQHPLFHLPTYRILPYTEGEFTHAVMADDTLTANFHSHKAAVNYVAFMTGERMNK